MLLAISLVRIVVLIEKIARKNIGIIDTNFNNVFLPQNFHIYSMDRKEQSQKMSTQFHVCDDNATSRIYISEIGANICEKFPSKRSPSATALFELDKTAATVKFHPNSQTVVSLCRIEGDDVLLIQTGLLTVEDLEIKCSMSVNIRYPIEMDIFAIANLTPRKNKNHLKLLAGNWPLLCSSIEYGLLPTVESAGIADVALVVQNSHIMTHGKQSFSFWIESCNIKDATVIFQRSSDILDSNNGKRSSCKVLSVTGAARGDHDTLCLEDTFIFLSEKLRYQQGDVMVSSIGIDAIVEAFDGESASQNTFNLTVNEILDTIKAFHLAKLTSVIGHQRLKIRSVWRYLLERVSEEVLKSISNQSVERDTAPVDISRAVHSVVSSSTNEESTRALKSLESIVSYHASLLNSAKRPKYASAVASEMRYAVIAALCEGPLLPDGMLREPVGLWFRESHRARESLSDALQGLLDAPVDASWLNFLQSHSLFRWVNKLLFASGSDGFPQRANSPTRFPYDSSSKHLLTRLLNTLTGGSSVTNVSSNDVLTSEKESTDKQTCTDTSTSRPAAGFVLIFVRARDQVLATNYVSSWYEGCPACAPGASYQYLIFTSEQDPQISPKLVALRSLEFVKRTSARRDHDALMILLGIDAVSRFIPPNPANTGMFTYLSGKAYGKISIVDGSIAFAVDWNPALVTSCSSAGRLAGCPSPNAFGGRVRDVVRLLRDVTESFGEYWSMRDIVMSYAFRNPTSVIVDTAHNFFIDKPTSYSSHHISQSSEDGDISGHLGTDVQAMYTQAIAFLRDGKLLRGVKLAYHCYKHSPEEVGPAFTSVLHEMSRRVVGNRGVFSSASLLAVADFLTNIYQTNGIRSIENAPLRYVQGHVIPLRIRIERVNNHNQLIRAFPILISNLYYLSGLVKEAIVWFGVTTPNIYFTEVLRSRQIWIASRESMISATSKLHIITTSTSDSSNIDNLVLSAGVASVNVTVLEIEGGFSCAKKLARIREELDTNEGISDSDAVLVVDGYDVLFTPIFLRAIMNFRESPTPIQVCGENAVYPDFAAPWQYPRQNTDIPKFLNGGCVMGRAKEMKSMYAYVAERTELVNDDQQTLIEYFLQNPQVVSIDTSERIFKCGFREDPDSFNGLFEDGVVLIDGDKHPVGIVHCNNRLSSPLYEKVLAAVKAWNGSTH